MPANLGNSAVVQGRKKSVFIPIPKKGNVNECLNYRTIALVSLNSKERLKILQARLQQYLNQELPDFQAGYRRGTGTRDQIANIHWIIEKARKFQKIIYFCRSNKLGKIQETGIADYLIYLLRNLYVGQEVTVRTKHGTTDWFQIGKGGILSKLHIVTLLI